MEISTLPATQTNAPEQRYRVKKTILLILFVSLAITALADSIQLFNELSTVQVMSSGLVWR